MHYLEQLQRVEKRGMSSSMPLEDQPTGEGNVISIALIPPIAHTAVIDDGAAPHHALNSAASTPLKGLMHFFSKVTKEEHIVCQDRSMIVDIMDLRHVQPQQKRKRSKRKQSSKVTKSTSDDDAPICEPLALTAAHVIPAADADENEDDGNDGEQDDSADADENEDDGNDGEQDDSADADENEIDDDDGVDLFDLRTAVPAVAAPIVALKKKVAPKKKRVGLRVEKMPFYDACAHSGSNTTSGKSGSDDESSKDDFVDDSPMMSRAQQKQVDQYMMRCVGSIRKHK